MRITENGFRGTVHRLRRQRLTHPGQRRLMLVSADYQSEVQLRGERQIAVNGKHHLDEHAVTEFTRNSESLGILEAVIATTDAQVPISLALLG